MASLYTVIPGLRPSSDEILEAELLAKQILEAEFPDLDLREGTGLRDLVLRPNSFVLALCRKAMDYYFVQNTIKGVNDSTPTELVDDILSNWFISRHTGTRAVINARLYFARQKNVTLTTDLYFSTNNSLLFYPMQTQVIPSASMNYDSYQNEYYIDVDLIAAEAGTSYNLGQGSLLYFTNFDPYFLHAEINYLSNASTDAEKNSEFIKRAETAISTRNLINVPSITSRLQEEFNYLKRIESVGMGRQEMIRDIIKVNFDPEAPRAISALTLKGQVATATLRDHRLNPGQRISITNAFPEIYNGTYLITEATSDTFSWNVPVGISPIIRLPSIQTVTNPVMVHAGGVVDVYCGDRLTSSLIQVTADSYGNVDLTGPIYFFQRSDIGAGSEDDSIPFHENMEIDSYVVDRINKSVTVTSEGHHVSFGDKLLVKGFYQSLPITRIDCNNMVVTVISTNHGLEEGASVTIQDVTPTMYNGTYQIQVIDQNTFTYDVPANIVKTGTGGRLVNPTLDNDYVAIGASSDKFVIDFPNMWSNAQLMETEDGISVGRYVPFSASNPYLASKTIDAITGLANTVTVTSQNHGLVAGRYIKIRNVRPYAYTGVYRIEEVLNNHQFTYTIEGTISQAGQSVEGSVMQYEYVAPWDDVGFSDRQKITVSFGDAYAGKTATFEVFFFEDIDGVQNYIEDPANRVVCGDYLARGFNFYLLDLDVMVYNTVAPSTYEVSNAVTAYLNSLAPGATLIMSDLVATLTAAGITNLQTPLKVTFRKFHRDLFPTITATPEKGVVEDYLDPRDATNVFLLGNVTTDSINV